jgi:hypothetical protein
MVECREGHLNPSDWDFCGECGSPLEQDPNPPADKWSRKVWLIIGMSLFAVVVISISIVGVVKRGDDIGTAADTSSGNTVDAAVLDWWQGARKPFVSLQNSLDDARRALVDADRTAMNHACQQMHDAAAVDLPARLPAPTQELTSELTAAVTDAHDASHMCMSVLEGSTNSYDGEFPVDLKQAEKHLAAAEELILQVNTASP